MAMRARIFAMLILAACVPARGQQGPPPGPERDRQVISVGVMGGDRKVHQVSISVPAPPAPDDEDEGQPRPRPVVRIDIQNAVLEPESFDRWLFGDEASGRAPQRHLEDLLRIKIESVAARRRMTGAQREKLRLAGRGDIKRFFDQVEGRRKDFEKERRSFRSGLAALRRLDAMAPLYHDGPFGDGSLFAKMLRRIEEEWKAGATSG
jgi:hypothetical protein